ncbi:MAG TPA: DUF3488 and transglutaminase-like domain-containing protein [Acidimicrobiia bacterium]|nr:DUF3488 and transglutaminase-like domain-containing protein [Acidimicrobiia bacterium]
MGRRIGQLAGFLGFVLAIGRLGKLLQTGPQQPQWQLILVASTFLGAVAWWLLTQFTTSRSIRLTMLALGGALLVMRIAAPETLFAGILPTGETVSTLGAEMDLAWRTIRRGVPPVVAGPGLLAILATLMWGVGALYSWGSSGGPAAATFAPSLIVYFQFAVFDRVEAGLGWISASSIALGLAIVALAMERRRETGRARDSDGRPTGRRSIVMAGVMATVLAVGAATVADSASAVVSEYGNAPWRGGGGGGYGSGDGGISFNRLVGLRQRVLNRSDEPVFVATLGPGAPPANEIYWRVETLDQFDGTEWERSDFSLFQYQPGRPLANESDVYQGPTSDFLQRVRIANLVTDVAPTAGVPVEIHDLAGDGARRPAEFQVLSDSAIVAQGGLREGDEYEVRTLLADRDADLGVLATGEDGELTPMFAAAAAAGAFPHEPGTTDEATVAPADLDRLTVLPEDIPTPIRNLARSLTLRASSDFEAVWMLQSWFRDSGEFEYSIDVETGHSALDLEAWLTDSTSLNFRTGYCEQFAAAMAVMVRFLDIPSRVVWGFTPGSVEAQSNGSEVVVVRDTNAHAWVEVWLEPYGWVQFDPTPRAEWTGFESQPPSITAGFDPSEFLPEVTPSEVLPGPEIPAGEIEGGPDFVDPDSPAGARSAPRFWLIGILAGALFLGAIPLAKRIRRRRRLARIRAGDITAAWDEIVDRLTDLGEPVPASMTPMELARSTDHSLLPLAISYSSTVYGGRTGQARESDLHGVEWWIERTYQGSRRARAAMSLRSLRPRD